MREKAFEEYIRDNVSSWFDWSKKQKLPVDRMEDLILVTECTLVELWAAAAFIGRSETAKIALVSSPEDSSGPSFEFRNFGGDVAHNCSYFDSVRVFLPFICRALIFIRSYQRVTNPMRRISASLSRASEQSVSCSGRNPSELQQNTFLTTLITIVRMRYK